VTTFAVNPNTDVMVASATDAARATRDQLLIEAARVTAVADRLDADDAISVLRQLKTFLSEIEKQRELVKAPVLKLSRDIDGLARELVADVKTHESRISRLCGAFEAEERRKAEDARRAAEAEAARIAYEAAQATRKAIHTAVTPEAAVRATDEISGKAQTQIAEVRAAVVAPPKPAASTLRGDVCFEVTDIKALHAAEPNLVTLEPNGTAIRSIIKANPNIQLPGVRHWIEQKLNLR
jgi:hypothetical protein